MPEQTQEKPPSPAAPSQSATAHGGAATNIAGSGHVTQSQNVTVQTEKAGKFTSVVVPIVAALISAFGGAYATHQYTLMRAESVTENGTETLLGIAKGAIELAQANQASPELMKKLEALSSQAQAVQVGVQALKDPPGGASLQADFWLADGQGAKLPKEGTVGVNRVYGPGDIYISFNGGGGRIPAGKKLEYKAKDGSACFLVYVGAAPDGRLHGFKTWCEVG